jgi:predicted dehydrogenase
LSAAPLRIGVIGLGAMGLRHARAVAAHPDAILAAAVDPDRARHPGDLGCPIHLTQEALIGAVDAVVIAAPTLLHTQVAVPLLDAGISCLIEKPVALTQEEFAALRTAASKGAVIRAGHIERFNPAIRTLLALKPKDIRAITARRISGASARMSDVDVIVDLMVHDLDAVMTLKGLPVAKVDAKGTRDNATAVLTFSDGATATVTADRTTPMRVRELTASTGDGGFQVDYIARSLTKDGLALEVVPEDALAAELTAFIAAVRGAQNAVTLDEAEACMKVVWRIQKALGL